MSEPARVREIIDEVYRFDSRRVLATLVRLLGDFDVAEEALHDAFVVAMERWPQEGVPANPRTWLVSTGRFKAIDALRRRAALDVKSAELAYESPREQVSGDTRGAEIEDDRLRLIFTCCHPALGIEAQVALTLRTVCGLTTEEIASAFMIPAPTLAQRIVRAKNKIRDARIPYEIPEPANLPERLDAVLAVVYLVFNEGYATSSGDSHVRGDLCAEAIRLGRLLMELLPHAEAQGLLALMLLHDSRRVARTAPEGDPILLEDQDRSLWNRAQIAEGVSLTERALRSKRYGAYALQAAIAAVHAEARTPAETNWLEIVGLYDALLRVQPSPVAELNRAVAVAMSDGDDAGLALIDELLARGELGSYALAHSSRAALLRRMGERGESRAAYETARELSVSHSQRRFLDARLRELQDQTSV